MRRTPSQWLIRRAAHHAPADLQERLEEEWSAALLSRNAGWLRLSFALGCCWATRIIACEHVPLIPATQPALGNKLMNAYAQHNVGIYSRRTMSLLMVIGLHAAVFAALMITISTTKVMRPPGPIIATYLDHEKPHETVSTVPTVKNSINIHIETKEIEFPRIDLDTDTTIIGDSRAVLPPLGSASQPPVHVTRLEQGGAGAGFPDPEGFYPAQSIRLGEQGLSVVEVCVNAKGRLTADPVTSKSSGTATLDLAALKLARAGSGHYRPSSEDGVAVDSCYPVGIRFRLKNP